MCQVPNYLAAQYLGAFTASCTVFLAYWDALVWYEHDHGAYRSTPETAAIFSTYPSPHLSFIGGIADQFLGTLLLLVCICASHDTHTQVRIIYDVYTWHLKTRTLHSSRLLLLLLSQSWVWESAWDTIVDMLLILPGTLLLEYLQVKQRISLEQVSFLGFNNFFL